jgi:cytoskeletal protein RodZ
MGVSQESAPARDVVVKAAALKASFGQYLQAIRIQKQISLEQVAEETRIRLAILRALEQEDFGQLPPDVFAIGFLKAYARAVGADGNEAVQRYYAQRQLQQQTLQPPPEPRRRSLSGKLILVLTMLAVLIAACLIAYQQWREAPAATTPVTSTPIANGSVSPPAELSANQPPSDATKGYSIPPTSRHLLMIAAHENSWVKVVIDQGPASEHKLKAGDQLRLEARTGFNLLIGNVGGVKLILDNQPVTIPGKRGEVVNIHLP